MYAQIIGAVISAAASKASKSGEKSGGKSGGKPGGGLGGKLKGMAVEAPTYGTIGAIKSIKGLFDRKKADAAAPQAVSPEERASQVMLQRQLSALKTGTANQATRQSMKESLREGYRNMYRMGGKGRDFSRLFSGYQQGLRKLAAQQTQAENTVAAKLIEVSKSIAQRKRDLQQHRQDVLSARAEQTLKEGKAASSLALAKAIGVKGGGSGTGTSSIGSSISRAMKANQGQTTGSTKTTVEDVGFKK